MSLGVGTNIAALGAQFDLAAAHREIASQAAHLASGLAIARAADDASGLTITHQLTSQINSLVQSVANAQDAAAVAMIADGALATVGDTLQRIWQLLLHAGNEGAQDGRPLTAIAGEVGALTELLNAIAEFTASGSQRLLGGEYLGVFQVGDSPANTLTLDLSHSDMHAANFGGGTGGDGINLTAMNILQFQNGAGGGPADGGAEANDDAKIYSANGLRADLAMLTASIQAVSDRRSTIGAVQRQLDYTVRDLRTNITAITASRSTLADADMAYAAGRYMQAQITATAATAVLAQANSAPKVVLRLLSDVPGYERAGEPGRRSDSRRSGQPGTAASTGGPAGRGDASERGPGSSTGAATSAVPGLVAGHTEGSSGTVASRAPTEAPGPEPAARTAPSAPSGSSSILTIPPGAQRN